MSKKRKILAKTFCRFNLKKKSTQRSKGFSKLQTENINRLLKQQITETQTLQKNKNKVIKSVRESKYMTHRRILIRIMNDLSSQTVEIRGRWNDTFKVLKYSM